MIPVLRDKTPVSGSWVVEGKELQHRNGGAGMRFYHAKPAKNRCKPELILTASTCPAHTVHLSTFQHDLCYRSEETVALAGNTHGTVDFHPQRC